MAAAPAVRRSIKLWCIELFLPYNKVPLQARGEP